MDSAKGLAPSSWTQSAAAQAGVDHHWVNQFQSSELKALIREGLQESFDLKNRAEEVIQAEQMARLAGVATRPQANLGLQGRRSKQNFIGFPGSGSGVNSSITTVYGASFDLSWEMDLWGRMKAAQEATIGEWEASRYDYQAAKLSLAAQITKAYFTVLEVQQQEALAGQAITVRERTRNSIRERFEKALIEEGGTIAQFRSAEADVAAARANRVNWSNQLGVAKRQLEQLMGRYPAGKIVLEGNLPTKLRKVPIGLPSELLQRRPDILAAERRLAAQELKLREAERAIFPSLTLNPSLGSSSTRLSDLLKSSFGAWSLGGKILQPVLTGGRFRHETKLRESRVRSSVNRLQKTVLDAFGEVEESLQTERLTRLQIKATKEALHSAQQASQSAQGDYRRGGGSVITLLRAETQEIQFDSQLIQLQRAMIHHRVNLHLALGGDYKLHSK